MEPGPMVPASFALIEKRQETADTWTLELEPPSAEAFAFAPGQFTMLSAAGSGEVPISISGDPDRHDRVVQTVRRVGLATAALCDASEVRSGRSGRCRPLRVRMS
jgi:NAD(P)H-flavin reductase